MTSGLWDGGLDGAPLSIAAFNQAIPHIGGYGVTIGMVLFATSTMFGWSYYGEKALEYLNEVSQTYDDTVIKAYCRNEMVNSVLSTYNTRFEEQKIPWDTQVTIGEKLPCSEMMFCAILSNVLENAMHAVQELPESRRRIELSLSEKAGHLLLMVKNPVQIMPVFTDGIPVTERSGHGLGVRSIVYYVEKLNGQYQFRMEDEEFVVRLIF